MEMKMAHNEPDFSTVLAQMDSIRATTVLQPLSKLVIAGLEYNMRQNKHENWLEVFLSFFMILSELGNLARDACVATALAGNATEWTNVRRATPRSNKKANMLKEGKPRHPYALS